jgi:hypothetical protein
VTERGRRRKRSAWKVHESRTLRAADLTVVDGLPSTSVVRTILDLPAVGHPYLVGRALDDACRRWPTRAIRLVRSIGLPDPVPQFRVADGDDFVASLDLAWPDIRWWVECDGLAAHWGRPPTSGTGRAAGGSSASVGTGSRSPTTTSPSAGQGDSARPLALASLSGTSATGGRQNGRGTWVPTRVTRGTRGG